MNVSFSQMCQPLPTSPKSAGRGQTNGYFIIGNLGNTRWFPRYCIPLSWTSQGKHDLICRFRMDTTGLSYFAECHKHSAKARKYSATTLPSVAHGEEHTVFKLWRSRLCRVLFLGHSAKCCRVPGRTRQQKVNGTVIWETWRANRTRRDGTVIQ